MKIHNHILVLGLGLSGMAAAKLAQTKANNVTVLDSRSTAELIKKSEELHAIGIIVHLNYTTAVPLDDVDLIIASPGIPSDGIFAKWMNQGHKVVSELEFGCQYINSPIFAVTGTNGKTTTVELITHILNSTGKRAVAAGNIGVPVSEIAQTENIYDIVVVEVSSFQLEKSPSFKPFAAAVLNISSDHIDRYDSFHHYADTKMKLCTNLSDTQHIILNATVFSEFWKRPQPPILFSAYNAQKAQWTYNEKTNGIVDLSENCVIELSKVQLLGKHNIENIMAAVAMCRLAGIEDNLIADAVYQFQPTAHRLQFVARIEGIEVYNDSKSTNPDALLKAIETLAEKQKIKFRKIVKSSANYQQIDDKFVILIAGGKNKGMDFAKTLEIMKKNVKVVLLIGETANILQDLWKDKVECICLNSLQSAVKTAFEKASENNLILLSPGCASQDMFHNYVDRGNQFCELILRR